MTQLKSILIESGHVKSKRCMAKSAKKAQRKIYKINKQQSFSCIVKKIEIGYFNSLA